VTKRGAKRADRRRALVVVIPLVLLASQTLASASTWVDGVRIPSGYRVSSGHNLGGGVWHLTLTRRGHQVVNVARLSRGSSHTLRVLLSNGRVSGPAPRTERTSTMCQRVRCLAAVNGSFFTTAGAPVGGLIGDGRPLSSPVDARSNFSVSRNGTLDIGRLSMTPTLTASYPKVPAGLLRRSAPPDERAITLGGVNTRRAADAMILYTPSFGPTTEAKGGTELTARVISPAGPIQAGVPTVVELVSARSGGSAIPSNGVVLSGSGDGASTLAGLWNDVRTGRAESRATLMVAASPAVVQSVAGKPVLLRDGERATRTKSNRDARTMIGWNSRGDVLLVTVDGSGPGRSGLSVVDAANLMRSLGAVWALNLDGGGSTTFVLKGRLTNRPSTSSHHERGVAVAVAIV
jgi:large repetitive protein